MVAIGETASSSRKFLVRFSEGVFGVLVIEIFVF
jgi:hypothetical protein